MGMKAKTISVVVGALGLIKKGLEKYIQQILSNIKFRNYSRSHYLEHPNSKKGTLHQINSYLILTLGPRNGLGYCILLTHPGLQSSKHSCSLLPACPTIIIFYLLVTTYMCTRDDEE